MEAGPGHIGDNVFDKFIKLFEEILREFFAPLLVISVEKYYFLGTGFPFALVFFWRRIRLEHQESFKHG